MLKKNSKNLWTYGKEDHTTETAEELNEQGAVSHADAEEVSAPAVPEADVTEAGDDIGQETPKEEISPDYKSDITSTDGADADVTSSSDSATTGEVNELIQEGEQAAATKDEIVEHAINEVAGGTGESDSTDVNGNPITEEQAAVNKEENDAEADVEEEVEEEAAAKNIHQEAAEVDENSDEELNDAIGDPSDEVAADGDTAADEGTEETEDGLDDDTPLEGAELETEGEDGATDTGGDTSTAGDMGSEATVGGDDVAEEVDDQNAAAEVTDETTGQADAEADTSEGAESEPMVDDAPVEVDATSDVTDDGASTDTTTDVESSDSEDDDTPLEGAEELNVNAETPLVKEGGDAGDSDETAATVEETITEGTSEDLQDGLDDVADATAEVEEDSGESTDGTVEETTLAEGEADGAIGADTGDETGEGTAESEAEVVEEAPPADAIDTDADVEETVETTGPDIGAGEVEETEEEANFDEGEVDVKDVDMDTTDEDVEEAMDKAAEVGEWGDKEESDAELADKTIEELQKEKSAMEKFRCMLEDSIANEAYSPGLLAYMVAEAEPLRKRLAKLDAHFDTPMSKKVSLEDFGAKDMDLAYRATLESFQGMISRLSTLTTSLLQKVENWWSRSLVDKVTTRADALDKQIDLCLIQLKDSTFTTGEVTGVRGYLATDETNLPKAVAADLATTTDIAIKGIKASEQLQSTVVKAVNDIIAAGSEQEISKVLDQLASMKNIKSSFPSAAFDKGLLGGYKLEIREGSGGDRSEKIEALGHTGIPVGVKAKGRGENTTYTLSKGDIANLLKMAKTYVGIARKLATSTGDRAINLTTKVRTTRNRALPMVADTRIRGDEHGVDAAATAMKLLAKAHLDLYKFITKHCVEVADALCGVAKKATK